MSPILPIEKTVRPRLRQPVEDRRLRRRHGVVVPVGGALEGLRRLADERPRDHPADVERVAESPRDLADLVEPVEAEVRLVRRDLEDRIGRRVADRLARSDVLLAELLDDRHARGVLVAEDARQFRLA